MGLVRRGRPGREAAAQGVFWGRPFLLAARFKPPCIPHQSSI